MKTHHDLIVWQKSIEFVTKMYQLIGRFPKSESYGLSSQLRRSSVSIPSNIAEGAARGSKKEFKRFLNIALSSASELETQLIICKNISLLNHSDFATLNENLSVISKMIQGLKHRISTSY
ncbi:MAG: four helix bundle protein [Schleiferiaceae bacterium]